jgi:hypothetical protein
MWSKQVQRGRGRRCGDIVSSFTSDAQRIPYIIMNIRGAHGNVVVKALMPEAGRSQVRDPIR